MLDLDLNNTGKRYRVGARDRKAPRDQGKAGWDGAAPKPPRMGGPRQGIQRGTTQVYCPSSPMEVQRGVKGWDERSGVSGSPFIHSANLKCVPGPAPSTGDKMVTRQSLCY